MDGKKASLLSGGACLGILMGPIVMGQTMNSDPTSLLYLMLVCIVCFSTFGLSAGAVGVSITREGPKFTPLLISRILPAVTNKLSVPFSGQAILLCSSVKIYEA